MKKIIKLKGEIGTNTVWLDGKKLDPAKSQKVYNHSPTGFSWGYAGSGPAQLALAILLELTDKATAQRNYQRFKFDVIASAPQTDFEVEFDVSEYI